MCTYIYVFKRDSFLVLKFLQVDTIIDKMQRQKEAEAAEKAKLAQAEEAQKAEVARLMETLTPAQVPLIKESKEL